MRFVVDVRLSNAGLQLWMLTGVKCGNSTGPIDPEHLVHPTPEDLVNGRDAVLGHVLEFLRETGDRSLNPCSAVGAQSPVPPTLAGTVWAIQRLPGRLRLCPIGSERSSAN